MLKWLIKNLKKKLKKLILEYMKEFQEFLMFKQYQEKMKLLKGHGSPMNIGINNSTNIAINYGTVMAKFL